MSRREDSKRERIRAEEEALNKQLQDAGLYEEGMGLEEKRTMLQLLEESRASAQQEAKEREHWRQQEEQILNETLNKSFNDNPEEDQQSAIGSSIQDNEDNSRDSDVVAIPSGSDKHDVRNSGAENPSRGEEEKETEQITSSIALQRQVPNGQFLEDGRDEEEEEEDSNMVPCPLCEKHYPMKQIEIHASDCLETNDLQQEQVVPSSSRQSKRKVIKPTQAAEEEEDMEIEEVMEMRGESIPTVVGRARTPPGKVRCTYCKVVMKEGDDYLIHVQSCIAKQQIKDSIMSPSSANTPAGKSGFKRVGGLQSQGLRGPGARAGSLFDHLEGGLVCVRGDITAPEYSNIHTALVQILNCVAVRPHGLSEVLAKKYPYSDLYSSRRQIKNYNRSVVEDRPRPGTIGICRPKTPFRGPIVVDVFGQFYMGKERNRNLMNKRLAKTLQDTNNSSERDPELLEGLIEDTADNRIRWFREALEQLAKQVMEEDIKHVVFPYCIGCGLAGGNWERNYHPAIKKFAEKAHPKVVV